MVAQMQHVTALFDQSGPIVRPATFYSATVHKTGLRYVGNIRYSSNQVFVRTTPVIAIDFFFQIA